MKIITSIPDMQCYARQQRRAGKTIAVVPTMGYLHDGHLSLIDAAQQQADIVVVTIFVNPTQFAPNEDLATYPRDFERDCQLCRQRGVDALFAPANEAVYAPDHSTWVMETELSKPLCGKSRPEHFRGVTTVVTKLFNAVLPDVAVFGQKDAQQAAVICRMVRDLNFPVKIIVSPLIRETDGLAMSSRNKYLSPSERQRATAIFKALQRAEKIVQESHNNCDYSEIQQLVRQDIEAAGGRIDYVELLDYECLTPVSNATRKIIIAVAVYFGNTRLIDNIIINLAALTESLNP